MIAFKYANGNVCAPCVDCGTNVPTQSQVVLSITAQPTLNSGSSEVYAPVDPSYEPEEYTLVNGKKTTKVGEIDFTCQERGEDPQVRAYADYIKDLCDISIDVPTICLDPIKTESVSFTVYPDYLNNCTIGGLQYTTIQNTIKYTDPRCGYELYVTQPITISPNPAWTTGPAGGSMYYAPYDKKMDYTGCDKHPQNCAFQDIYSIYGSATNHPTMLSIGIPIDRSVIHDKYKTIEPIPEENTGGGTFNDDCCNFYEYQYASAANYCRCAGNVCGVQGSFYCGPCPCYGCVDQYGSCNPCPDPPPGEEPAPAAAQAVFF